MKAVVRILVFFVLLLAGCGAWIWYEAHTFLNTPPQAEGRKVLFDVPAGAHLPQIARSLAEKGLITSQRNFEWLARLKNRDSQLQAGRFELNSGWKPQEILDTLVSGRPVLHRITIPEGLTWWQTARLLDEAGFARYEDFAAVVRDPDFLRHYGIPFKNAEGFLMPDTYLVRVPETSMPAAGSVPATEQESVVAEQWRAQARSVAGRMVDNFWRKADGVFAAAGTGKRPRGRDLQRLVTLASIVEKETRIPEERPRVAGVYANRLQKNMLLQADPTVIYGLGEKFVGPLTRKDLEDNTNPYNTYRRAGLPPGPICSFGEAAFRAAALPEVHDYLYFVAITDGGAHAFSRTLNEHNAAVRAYREQKRGR